MTDAKEHAYSAGRQGAFLFLLRTCISELGYGHPDATEAAWILERQETMLALRKLCEAIGDNDWPDDLYLPDVIEKHLLQHVGQN